MSPPASIRSAYGRSTTARDSGRTSSRATWAGTPTADPNAPHVFFDDGWRPPGSEFGAYVRRTRTRRAGLIVPIRRPRDFDAVFRAHANPEAGSFGVELVVNGESAGVVEAVPRWQEYRFSVPVERLRPGFNVFELRFSAPDSERRLELAVSFLQLRESELLRDRESAGDSFQSLSRLAVAVFAGRTTSGSGVKSSPGLMKRSISIRYWRS